MISKLKLLACIALISGGAYADPGIACKDVGEMLVVKHNLSKESVDGLTAACEIGRGLFKDGKTIDQVYEYADAYEMASNKSEGDKAIVTAILYGYVVGHDE